MHEPSQFSIVGKLTLLGQLASYKQAYKVYVKKYFLKELSAQMLNIISSSCI